MRALSIDVDYITNLYSPILSFFIQNNFSDNPKEFWDGYKTIIDSGDESYIIDDKKFKFLVDVFTKSLNSKKVVFGYKHDSILYYIDKKLVNDVEIINIDNHHDIFYCESDQRRVAKNNFVSEACWVYYLNGKLKKYTWIHGEKSKQFQFENNLNFTYIPTIAENYIFNNYDFDLVYVCLSPQYILPRHWFIFDTLKIIYSNITKQEPELCTRSFGSDIAAAGQLVGLPD